MVLNSLLSGANPLIMSAGLIDLICRFEYHECLISNLGCFRKSRQGISKGLCVKLACSSNLAVSPIFFSVYTAADAMGIRSPGHLEYLATENYIYTISLEMYYNATVIQRKKKFSYLT